MKLIFLGLTFIFVTACTSTEKREPQQVIGEVGGRAMIMPESGTPSADSLSATINQNLEIFQYNLASVPEPDQIENSAISIKEPSIASYRACFKNGFKTSEILKRESCERYFIKLAPFIEAALMQSEKYKVLKKLNTEIAQQANFLNQKIAEAYPANTDTCMDMRRDVLEKLVKAMDETPMRAYDIERQFETPKEAIQFLEKAKLEYSSLERFINSTPNDREATIRNGMKLMGANRLLRDNMLNRSWFESVKFVTSKRMNPNCGF